MSTSTTDTTQPSHLDGQPEARVAERLSPLVWGLSAAGLLLHLATGWRYGLFRDEFYYLACADHLAWGYVDHPPLSIAVLAGVRALLGDSLFAVRLVPALLCAALVLLAGRLALEMGGRRFAQGLAALGVLVAPQYLGITGFYSMNAFDLLFWAAGAWIVVRIVKTGQPLLWWLLGLVLGLGLLNKISVLFFGAGLAVAIALTPLRGHLRRPAPWIGAAIALALFLPHVLWQAANGWPTAEFVANAKQYKIAALTPAQFLGAQILEMHPFNALVWLTGLGWLLVARAGRPFRPLGIVYVVALVALVLQRSKPYYLAPAYTMLLAAGALALENATARWGRTAARAALCVVLALGGMLTAPLAVPVLPVETAIAYRRALGLAPVAAENHALGPFPQHFADRFGWHEMTAVVLAAYAKLTPEEQRDVMIVTSNYGEAGALNYYGRRHGLPRAVSQHNNYFLWGPGPASGQTVIAVGIAAADLKDAFEQIAAVGRVESPYAMPFETRHPVLLCRGLKLPLADAWHLGKRFI